MLWGLSATHMYEAVQAIAPELSGASEARPKPMTSRAQISEGRSRSCELKQDFHMLPHATAPPLHSGEGEQPAIQMQGLDSLIKPPKTPQQSQLKSLVAQQQAAAVPAESPPLPLSSSPVSGVPCTLPKVCVVRIRSHVSLLAALLHKVHKLWACNLHAGTGYGLGPEPGLLYTCRLPELLRCCEG